jgi:hypothetical protein
MLGLTRTLLPYTTNFRMPPNGAMALSNITSGSAPLTATRSWDPGGDGDAASNFE